MPRARRWQSCRACSRALGPSSTWEACRWTRRRRSLRAMDRRASSPWPTMRSGGPPTWPRRLGLPFHTPACALQLTDKRAQREALDRAGLVVPRSWVLTLETSDIGTSLPSRPTSLPRGPQAPPWRSEPRHAAGRLLERAAPARRRPACARASDEGFVLEEFIPDATGTPAGVGFAGYVSVERLRVPRGSCATSPSPVECRPPTRSERPGSSSRARSTTTCGHGCWRRPRERAVAVGVDDRLPAHRGQADRRRAGRDRGQRPDRWRRPRAPRRGHRRAVPHPRDAARRWASASRATDCATASGLAFLFYVHAPQEDHRGDRARRRSTSSAACVASKR